MKTLTELIQRKEEIENNLTGELLGELEMIEEQIENFEETPIIKKVNQFKNNWTPGMRIV